MGERDWYPGAARDPGVNSGYAGGVQSVGFVACHYTVGHDSRSIGRNGYFNFLVREGVVWQYAEANAVTWHACEWNHSGPGIEVESLGPPGEDVFRSDADRAACAALLRWLHDTYGVSLDYRDTPGDRIPVGGAIHGFVSHRSLHENACDEHYDWWPQEDWDLMVTGAPPVPPTVTDEEDDVSDTLVTWQANNDLTSDWHRAKIDSDAPAPVLWHEFYAGKGAPAGVGFEGLLGGHDAVPEEWRDEVPVKVTKQIGLAGNPKRLDLFVEVRGGGRGVVHIWRSTNSDPWRYSDERV